MIPPHDPEDLFLSPSLDPAIMQHVCKSTAVAGLKALWSSGIESVSRTELIFDEFSPALVDCFILCLFFLNYVALYWLYRYI